MPEAWRVSFDEAFDRWLEAHEPPPDVVLAVLNWVLKVTRTGPPSVDAFQSPVDEDAYTAAIRPAGVFVDYQAFGYERLVRVRAFETFPSA